MASTALLAVMASALFSALGSSWTHLNAPISALNAPKLTLFSLFALQLNDLDTGLGNELWFIVIIAVVAAGAYMVYRGPKHM